MKTKVAVAGLGLIGGSFCKAALRAGHDVAAMHHGDGPEALADAEIVMVCMPPEAIVPWIRAHSGDFAKGAAVVDICGVKTPVTEAMAEVVQDGWTFVGGHPMAGREVSGYENSLETLFDGASMILTPSPGVPGALVGRLKDFFATLGFARTVVTTPAKHDEMIAFTSQLCHVIATAYSRDPLVAESAGFSAGSYANMTRIATQNASDWSSLYLSDRDALLAALDRFASRLAEFRGALSARDADGIRRIIEEGAAAKLRELAAGGRAPWRDVSAG